MTLIHHVGPRGDSWGFRFWFRGKLYKQMVGHSKTLAREAEKRARAEAERAAFEARWGPVEPRRTAWADVVERYLEAKADKRSLAWDRRRLAWWGNHWQKNGIVSVQQISPELIDKGKVELATEGYSPATIERFLAVLRALCQLAIRRWRILAENPVLLVDWPRVIVRQPEIPARQQLEALIQKADPVLRAMILTAIQTGLRKGAMLALGIADVDVQPGMLRVQDEKGTRENLLPLPDALRGLLKQMGRPDGRIFPRRFPEERWRRLRASVGLPALRFHDLRHTTGTLLAEAGVGDRVIQQYLGHATPAMTQRYTHPRRPAMKEAAKVLSDALRTTKRHRKSASH